VDTITISIILTASLLALLSAGVWVALTLMAVGLLGMTLMGLGSSGLIFATTTWGTSSSWALTALPLFIWMGEILFKTKLSKALFEGLTPWLGRIPGQLLHVNILSCGVFAAVSGSSAATAATIGKMTLPELKKRGYSESMAIGTLAGSGTLGLLIPPSIILIVYGVAAEVSISRLFIAGAVPGLLLVTLFMAYTILWSMVYAKGGNKEAQTYSLVEKIKSIKELLPVVGLIIFVLGSIYTGLTTPTEAAAFGVVGALFLAYVTGALSTDSFKESLMGAVRTSCMISLILAGAAFLTISMGFLGIPRALATAIGELQLSPYMLLVYLTLLFVVLGCFLDGISVVVLTTSIVLPMVQQAGIDLLWFGIYIVLVVEMSQITPPVGFNLFVVQSLTGKNILYVAKAALPFFLLILLAVVLITIFPSIVTGLPMIMIS
jgi:C4-dicarboxylate transporter, DctM subunit